MKYILLLSLLFTIQTTANQTATEGFHCVPSPHQTRLQVLVTEKNIELLVINPEGYDFMPQFDSSSPYSLSFNKMQGDDLKNLGEMFTFSWPKDKCKIDTTNFEVNCHGEALQPVKEIKSYGLTTAVITQRYDGEVSEKRTFRFSAAKQNIYFVTLDFYKQSCSKF